MMMSYLNQAFSFLKQQRADWKEAKEMYAMLKDESTSSIIWEDEDSDCWALPFGISETHI